ncbi:HNH endonuclease [Planctomycetota bacterium]
MTKPISAKLNASEVQEIVLSAIRTTKSLSRESDDFIDRILGDHECTHDSLTRATEAVYKQAYYSFAKDINVDVREQRTLSHLARLLRLDHERCMALNYDVGLAIYKRRFRDASSDGKITGAEQDDLDLIAKVFGLRKRHISKAITKLALAHYSFVLADSVKDGVLTTEEMAELENIARRFGLTAKTLAGISVPDKKDILRRALDAIKAREQICDDDRAYVQNLAHYLNAEKPLLNACLKDLDLYDRFHAIRRGDLPVLDPGSLILDNAENLHFAANVTSEVFAGGQAKRTTGMLYLGSFKIRFIAPRSSIEIRYANIFEVEFVDQKSPKIKIGVSSGRGSGTYRLTKKNSPAAVLEMREIIQFLIRKSRKMIRPEGRASRYIPDDVRSEVWHRDGGACVLCDATEYLEFDHVIPISKGGDTSVGNLQLLCRKCNSEKSDHI